ncbi:unnamed protein product [Mytilus edulis]|uniref:TIR domain-containing protein n=1 Tax=Mytilus edulis TaxID=6550 RepID=A0A8S3SAY4_MYTED|nr:unnamed protein product [Mytilus edulis]
MPSGTTVVVMNGTNLTHIGENGLVNLTDHVIKKLEFEDNIISYIHPKAFDGLVYLSSLFIWYERRLDVNILKIVIDNMPKTHLKFLHFRFNQWTSLPRDMFMSFTNNSLRTLWLEGNRFYNMNCSIFSPLKKLKKLYLPGNSISYFATTGIPKTVMDLYLNNNSLHLIPNWCKDRHRETSFLPDLRNLELNSNNIGDIGKHSLLCLPRVEVLNLDGIHIGKIRDNIFASMKMLNTVKLSNIGNLKRIESFAFNSSSLISLIMEQTYFHFDRSGFNPQTIFASTPNLEFLSLSHNYFPKDEMIVYSMFSPLVRLKKLILASTRITILPRYVFSKFKSLRVLSLDANKITAWNNGADIFQNMTSLKRLILSNNQIDTVNESSFPPNMLRSVDGIDLSNNPYTCDCNLLWFSDMLKSTPSKFLQYPFAYRCHQPSKFVGRFVMQFVESKKTCPPWNPLYTMAICISSFGIIMVTFIFVGVKCQTNIKNYIYLWRVQSSRKKGYIPLPEADDFEYHAFVVYCDADRSWVHETFLVKMEREEGVKLCVHHRDFDVSESITENIDKYLERSWKVVYHYIRMNFRKVNGMRPNGKLTWFRKDVEDMDEMLSCLLC